MRHRGLVPGQEPAAIWLQVLEPKIRPNPETSAEIPKKVSLILSVLAALGFAIASPAGAKQQGGNGVHVNRSTHVNTTIRVNRSVHVNSKIRVNRTTVGRGRFVVGRTYNGRMWFGHNRHFWNGQWYDYGVGPCWINIDGEWFWNIAACPL